MSRHEMTVEEWLNELQRESTRTSDGLSCADLAKRRGKSTDWIRKHVLHPAHQQGILRVTMERRIGLSGRAIQVPTYRFVRKK